MGEGEKCEGTRYRFGLTGGALLPINLPVTEGGKPTGYGRVSLIVDDCGEGEKSFYLQYNYLKTSPKLFPDSTDATNTVHEVDVGFGSGGGSFGIGFQRKQFETPGRNIFGNEISGDSTSKFGFSLFKESGGRLGIPLGEQVGLHIDAGLRTAIRVASQDELTEYPGSALSTTLYLGLGLEFGRQNKDKEGNERYTDLDIAYFVSKELFDIAYAYTQYKKFDEPQADASEGIAAWMGSGEGMSGGNMWMIPPLESLMVAMGASSNLAPVRHYLKAEKLKWLGVLTPVIKSATLIGLGGGGEAKHTSLISSGISGINNLAIIGLYEVGIPEEYLFIAGWLLGTGEALSSLVPSSGSTFGRAMLSAGTGLSAGWAQDPAVGTHRFVKSKRYTYSPIGYMFGTKSGMTGGYSVESDIKGPFFTSSTITSPLLNMANAFSAMGNQFAPPPDQTKYYDEDVPSYVSSVIGVQYKTGEKDVVFRIGLGVGPIARFSEKGNTVGITAQVPINVLFGVGKKVQLTFGLNTSVHKTRDDFGVTLLPSIGIGFKQ